MIGYKEIVEMDEKEGKREIYFREKAIEVPYPRLIGGRFLLKILLHWVKS